MPRKKAEATVLVLGNGTIGEPLIYLLAEQKDEIGIGKILFHKRSPLQEERGKIEGLVSIGAGLVTDSDKIEKFKDLGVSPALAWEDAVRAADVVIDCTPEGNKLKEKYYLTVSKEYHKKGFIAQGSEKGFGIPYAWNINDCALEAKPQKFIQVVSCNTHQLVCPLFTILLAHEGLENLRYGKFFIARRGSDISEDKMNPGVEVEYSKEKYSEYGTHQGHDAVRVIKTIYGDEAKVPIHSQIIKAPTQYMHTMLFDIELKNPMGQREVFARLESNPLIVFTDLKSSNRVFARARDASKIRGRILNQTVLCRPSLDVSADGTHIRGTCFTPQDGNALLSSVAATLWLLDKKTYKEKMKVFDKFLFKSI